MHVERLRKARLRRRGQIAQERRDAARVQGSRADAETVRHLHSSAVSEGLVTSSRYIPTDKPAGDTSFLRNEIRRLRAEVKNLEIGLDAKQLEIVQLTEERDHLLRRLSREGGGS